LGIIGTERGSTLLKILSKVTAPTTGIKSRGRIASLLEVGNGFNGEMTGRENIFERSYTWNDQKKLFLDEIIDFGVNVI
jgi:lipopolysaccharide transport system ATP-binding protein